MIFWLCSKFPHVKNTLILDKNAVYSNRHSLKFVAMENNHSN